MRSRGKSGLAGFTGVWGFAPHRHLEAGADRPASSKFRGPRCTSQVAGADPAKKPLLQQAQPRGQPMTLGADA